MGVLEIMNIIAITENQMETRIIWGFIGIRVSQNYGYHLFGFPITRTIVFRVYIGGPLFWETIMYVFQAAKQGLPHFPSIASLGFRALGSNLNSVASGVSRTDPKP